MMKKQQKTAKFALTALALSLFATSAIAGDVTISQKPLLGVSEFTPAMVMAFSVEYPTAGVAYSTTQSLSLNAIKEGADRFDGYFDNTKCYTYIQTIAHGKPGGYRSGGTDNPEYLDRQYGTNRSEAEFNGSGGYVEYGDGYFKVTSDAQNIGGYQGLCGGELEWSGNMMNFMTMSAIDIIRKTLTGGNRAKGVGASEQVYKDGDTASKTYLRRANQWGLMSDSPFDNKAAGAKDQQQYDFTRRGFDWDVYGEKVNGTPLLKYLLPHNYYDYMVRMGTSGPLAKEPGAGAGVADEGWGTFSASNKCQFDSLAAIAFMNNGTGFNIGFLQRSGDNSLYNGNIFSAGTSLTGIVINPGQRVFCGIPYTAQTESGARASSKWFNVVVEQENKPTGILQARASEGMRVAAMGYLSEKESSKSSHDGGVLRAKMRDISTEINSDGTFKLNPDNASEGNSGVINYINKFGDRAPYDIDDPVAELYYSAIRYLRYGAFKWNSDGSQERIESIDPNPYPYDATDYEKDGFPAYKDWDEDPLRPIVNGQQTTTADAQCFSPTIFVLGDTNTHNDGNLPNYPGSSIENDNVALEKNGTTSYQKVAEWQGISTWKVSSGASAGGSGPTYAPTFGLAGLAHWVKTNDVRPDIPNKKRPMNISSFFIDVLEANIPKTETSAGYYWTKGATATSDNKLYNSYYLAGKFGGADYKTGVSYTRDNFDSTIDLNRSLWTNDPKGESSNEIFPLGMPKAYAVANTPKNMINAIHQAFQTIGFAENTVQSAVQANNSSSAELNLTSKNGSRSLINSGYIVPQTNAGKITGYSVTNKGAIIDLLKSKPEEVPLTFHAGYDTTKWTGYLKSFVLIDPTKDTDTYGSDLLEAELWDAGEELFKQYHNTNYTSRKVMSKKDNSASTPKSGFTEFKASNANQFASSIQGNVFEKSAENFYNALVTDKKSPENLINYMLGDNRYEGGNDFRIREGSLMGTSVYASVTPILKQDITLPVVGVPRANGTTSQCKYNSSRSGDYVATSSNEGMLHIFDMEGKEKFAYLPQTALPYIANYANPNYQHRYVNDGVSMLHEVCEGDVAKTYLIGTSGRGASSIYAIDITTDNFQPVFEVNAKTDPDIGLLVSSPIVANDANGKTVLIFSSGYNTPSDKGYLFVYDLKSGSQLNKIELGKSGVGSPVAYDTPPDGSKVGDGAIDRVYVGDYEGNLWRLSTSDGKWNSGVTKQKLFTAEKPLLNAPAVGKVGSRTAILIGTGTYLSFDDMLNSTQNYAYGIFDDGTVSSTISPSELHNQEFTTTTKPGENGKENYTFHEITHYPIPDDAKGWRLTLPKGYTVTSDSAFYGPNNEVATYTATQIFDTGNRQCNVEGQTMFIAVDAQNGGAYNRPILDVNNDRKFTSEDGIGGYSFGAVSKKGVYLHATVLQHSGPTNTAYATDGGSSFQVDLDKFSAATVIRRISWREIF